MEGGVGAQGLQPGSDDTPVRVDRGSFSAGRSCLGEHDLHLRGPDHAIVMIECPSGDAFEVFTDVMSLP